MTEIAHPTREKLSRERVVVAALHVMDAEGLEAVSMRRVAREVGVEAMSLYHYVADKDDLLDGIVEQVLLGFPTPEGDPRSDWRAYGRQVARAWRTVLKAHPNVLPLLAERKTATNDLASLVPMETALHALKASGLSTADAVQAFHAIGGYIFGFVMMESGQLFAAHPGVFDAQALGADLPSDRLPCIAEALPYLLDCDFDAQFEFGLDLMIEGLAARAAASSAPG
jgi:AcrR family transcriptional regulator